MRSIASQSLMQKSTNVDAASYKQGTIGERCNRCWLVQGTVH